VDVKLLPQDQELYVLAQSHARIHKERAMRRRKLKWLWARLKQISAMDLDREELLAPGCDCDGTPTHSRRSVVVG
jgi:hypothetical protein